MNGLITALAWLLIVLTFTGSYRVAQYLATPAENSAVTALYPTLIAATITVAFVVVFDFIILLTGLSAIILPGYLLVNPEKRPGLPRLSERASRWRDRLGGRGQAVYDTFASRESPSEDAENSKPGEPVRDK